jgi:predicted transcriptional regulator
MTDPRGTITPAQHEILRAVWQAGEAGATVAEIWRQITSTRDVSRTTILNLVDRLEKRGWLKRSEGNGIARYSSALGREETESRLAHEFVDGFFAGSAANLMASLLGRRKIASDELRRLRAFLGETEKERKGGAR